MLRTGSLLIVSSSFALLAAGEALQLRSYQEQLTGASLKSTTVAPPWPAGSVFVVPALQADPSMGQTQTPNGRLAVEGPLPAVIAGARVYAAANNPARGFPGPDGLIEEVLVADTDQASAWYPVRVDIADARSWSWDGTTFFAGRSDRTVRQADGQVAWTIPAEVRAELEAGTAVPVWGRQSLPRPCAVARLAPGAVGNERIGLLEMRGTETVAGAVTYTLSWLDVTATGCNRLTMATSPALPTDHDAFAFLGEITLTSRWAWCPTGIAVIEIERTGANRDGPGVITLQAWTPAGGKLAPTAVQLGKGSAATVQRYRDGYLVLSDVRLENGESNVAGVAGASYPFRQVSDRATRLIMVDAHAAITATWLLPGRWEPSPQRMRGDAVALRAPPSRDFPDHVLTALVNPLTGMIAAKALVSHAHAPALDAIWTEPQVAMMAKMPSLGRPAWLGDTAVVTKPSGASIPTTAQAIGGATAVAAPSGPVGRWQIVEGAGSGQFVEFRQDGHWTSPWGDFGGTWTSTPDGVALTANRPVAVTVLPDGRMRIAANVTLVIQRTQ